MAVLAVGMLQIGSPPSECSAGPLSAPPRRVRIPTLPGPGSSVGVGYGHHHSHVCLLCSPSPQPRALPARGATIRRASPPQPFGLPRSSPGERCHTVVGSVIAKADEIPIQLLGHPSLLAWPSCLTPQPAPGQRTSADFGLFSRSTSKISNGSCPVVTLRRTTARSAKLA